MPPAGSSPEVSVVIAAYNRSDTLRLTIESVLAQTFADFDVWVIGDACTDDSGQVVQSFGDQRLHWENLEKNTGTQSGPNNRGIQRSSGRWIAYLGHDDLWFPWHLETLLGTAARDNAS